MIEMGDCPRDLASLVVPQYGSIEATSDPFEPYRLEDADGAVVAPVTAYLRDLQACGRPATTQRSYGMDLLRWFRFLRAAGIGWDQATRAEARDFISWLQVTGKPGRLAGGAIGVNSVTGKPVPGDKYAPATVAHCETVLRSFYEFHLEAGSGPMVNPFPLVRDRRQGRPRAHRNPMEPWRAERSGRDHSRCAEFLRENWSLLVVPSLAVTEVRHLLAGLWARSSWQMKGPSRRARIPLPGDYVE
jgi:Phage integrase, N-terminal SAM-like domain